MGKMKRHLLTIVAIGVVTTGGLGALIWSTGYTISEMDWNSDGRTTLTEIFHSLDVGRRQLKLNGFECQEYYYLKDGLPVRVDCPTEGNH